MNAAYLHQELSPSDLRRLREALLDVPGDEPSADPTLAANDAAETRIDRVELLQRFFGPDLCRRLGIFRVPAGFKLSVVIPVFNEAKTIERVLERVRATRLPIEMVIVDDGSRDGTRDLLARLRDSNDPANGDLRIIFHERNQGKGAALKTGFAACTGDVVIVQDADMEYDPQDFRALLQPIVEGAADVVYGSRFSHIDGPVRSYWHEWGNRVITRLANWKSGRNLTDVETCYKLFRRELIQQLVPGLRERGFGIELEMTFKLSRLKGVRFYERPISYAGRSYAEGKKIGWRDGLWALWCIVRY